MNPLRQDRHGIYGEHMAGIVPYLHLPGTARAPLNYYAQTFGGTAEMHSFAHFGRTDGDPEAIAHGELVGGAVNLFIADTRAGEVGFRAEGLMLALLGVADPDTLKFWFEELAAGGTVVDQLQEREWGASDGQVIDRFGIHWLVGFQHAKTEGHD